MNITSRRWLPSTLAVGLSTLALAAAFRAFGDDNQYQDVVAQNAQNLIQAGRQTFRFDTFWG